MYSDRKYIIFDVSELDKVNFNKILETSKDTVRKTKDGKRCMIKWNNTIPDFVNDLITKSEIFNHDDISDIVSSKTWC